MPLTRSAIKKQRQDRKREIQNQEFKEKLINALKKAKKLKKPEILKDAISLVDKAVKKNLFHKNKAARLKSSLAKLIKTDKGSKEKTKERKPRKRTKSEVKTSSTIVSSL